MELSPLRVKIYQNNMSYNRTDIETKYLTGSVSSQVTYITPHTWRFTRLPPDPLNAGVLQLNQSCCRTSPAWKGLTLLFWWHESTTGCVWSDVRAFRTHARRAWASLILARKETRVNMRHYRFKANQSIMHALQHKSKAEPTLNRTAVTPNLSKIQFCI